MFRSSIRNKLLFGLFLGAVLPLLLLEFHDIRSTRNELEAQQFDILNTIADLKEQRVKSFFERIYDDTFFLSHLEIITTPFPVISEYYNDRNNPDYKEMRARLDKHLIPTQEGKDFLEIILADTEGRMIYNTGVVHNDDELGQSVEAIVPKNTFMDDHGHAMGHSHIHASNAEVYVSDVFTSPFSPSGFEMVTASPVYGEEGQYVGMVILAIDMGPVFDLILDRKGLGETGETLIGRNEGDHALFINPLRHDPGAALRRKALYSEVDALPVREATQGINGSGITTDYRGEEVIAAWRSLSLPASNLSWGIVAKIDTKEAFASSNMIVRQAIYIGIGALVLLLIAAWYFNRTIIRPLRELEGATHLIANGYLKTKISYKSKDEIGQVGQSFNNMADKLLNTQMELTRQNEKLISSIAKLESTNVEVQRSKKATLNVLEDVQEEKEKTQREKERISTILNSIGDGVFVVNVDYTIEAINPVAARLAGYDVNDAIGKPYKDVLKFIYEDSGEVNDRFVVDAIESGEVQEMANHTQLVRPDGTKIPVADSAAPLVDGDGDVIGCVVVFRDISKEYAIDKAKTEFVSLASHQLRTPLAAINWNMEMLIDEIRINLGKEEQQYLDDVYASGKRMSELVDALLNVSRIDLGTFEVDPEPTDIVKLSQDVVKDLQAGINKKGLKLEEVYIPEQLIMNVDSKLMRMVVENLLSNAVKYTPENKEIKITIEGREQDVLIKVEDQGYGIPENQKDKIFTRLFRADNVRTKDVEGTGLGLYIIKSIIEQSGGTIHFDSKEDEGTTFYVSMPQSGMEKKEGSKKMI